MKKMEKLSPKQKERIGNAQRQARRRNALDEIARTSGFSKWGEFETCVLAETRNNSALYEVIVLISMRAKSSARFTFTPDDQGKTK